MDFTIYTKFNATQILLSFLHRVKQGLSLMHLITVLEFEVWVEWSGNKA